MTAGRRTGGRAILRHRLGGGRGCTQHSAQRGESGTVYIPGAWSRSVGSSRLGPPLIGERESRFFFRPASTFILSPHTCSVFFAITTQQTKRSMACLVSDDSDVRKRIHYSRKSKTARCGRGIGISPIALVPFLKFARGHSAAGAPPATSREQTLWLLPCLVSTSSGALPSEESLRARLALLARWTRES